MHGWRQWKFCMNTMSSCHDLCFLSLMAQYQKQSGNRCGPALSPALVLSPLTEGPGTLSCRSKGPEGLAPGTTLKFHHNSPISGFVNFQSSSLILNTTKANTIQSWHF